MAILHRVVLFVAVATMAGSTASAQSAGKRNSNPGTSGAALQSTLEEKEKAGWEAFKNKDKQAFASLTTEDYTAVIADGKGARDRQGTLDSMNEITITDYVLSDFKLVPLAAKAAMLTYAASGTFNISGQAQVQKVSVTDVWVKRGGQWKSLRYHETEVK